MPRSSVPGIVTTDDGNPTVGVRGRTQLVAAVVDGGAWRAEDPVLVTLRSGLLGIASFDADGVGIALALGVDRVGTPQIIGNSLATGMVTIDSRTAVAAGDGGGFLLITSLSHRRVSGEFSFTAVLGPDSDRPRLVRVSEGRFDVRF